MDNDETRGSRVVRFSDFRWQGVDRQVYKDDEQARWRHVSRYVLAGDREGSPFHVRYFEVGPGGYTSLEEHGHEHVVLVLRGRGEVRLNHRCDPVEFGDLVYVAPNDPHQFRATGDEPFGFLCVVAAERDRPRAV